MQIQRFNLDFSKITEGVFLVCPCVVSMLVNL